MRASKSWYKDNKPKRSMCIQTFNNSFWNYNNQQNKKLTFLSAVNTFYESFKQMPIIIKDSNRLELWILL